MFRLHTSINKAQLYKKVGGSFTLLNETSYTVNKDTWYTLKLELDGSSIKCYVNGVEKISETDSSHSEGAIGVRGYSAVCSVDDVSVNSIEGPPPEPIINNISPDPAQIGTNVTITGSNFGVNQDSSYVTFGGGIQAINYTSWSDNQIVVTVPDGAQSGNVTVTTTFGTSDGYYLNVGNIIIVDNGEAGYTESGSWSDSTLTGYNGSSTRFGHSSGASAKWTPDLGGGTYTVSIYKVVHANSDWNSKIVINHYGGSATHYLNYTEGSSSWVVLGDYAFSAGMSGYVQITRNTSGYVRADAVKFECIDPTPPSTDYLGSVKTFADNMIDYAKDTYGTNTDMLLGQLDADTKTKSSENWWSAPNCRGSGNNMSNIQFDDGLLRLFYALTDIGEGSKYAAAANAYIDDYMTYAMSVVNDGQSNDKYCFAYGEHEGYNVVTDSIKRESHHEQKWSYLTWDKFYSRNSSRTQDEWDVLWKHITRHGTTGKNNRHWPASSSFTLPSSCGYWVCAWAYAYQETSDTKYTDRITKVIDYIWSNHGTTGLFPYPAESTTGQTAYTTPWGSYAIGILKAYDILGSTTLGNKCKDQAKSYIDAFLTYADFHADGSHYSQFNVTTGAGSNRVNGWDQYSIRTLASLAYAYKITGDSDYKDAFDDKIDSFNLANYKAGCSFDNTKSAGEITTVMMAFLNMYYGTSTQSYLNTAIDLADYSIEHYFKYGMFVAGVGPSNYPGSAYDNPNVDPTKTYSNRSGCDDMALVVLKVYLAKESITDNSFANALFHY